MGILSGSQIGVSGPAAGLAAIVLTAISALGGFENFLLAVVLNSVNTGLCLGNSRSNNLFTVLKIEIF